MTCPRASEWAGPNKTRTAEHGQPRPTIIEKPSRLANEAASAPRNAAATTAACAPGARPAGSAAAACAPSAAPASPAASAPALGVLLAGPVEFFVENFLVENEERPQADVGDFLFTEIDLWAWYVIPQRSVRCRTKGSCCVCAACQRHRRADRAGDRQGLLQVLSLRLLLLVWGMSRPPMPYCKCYIEFVAHNAIGTPSRDAVQDRCPHQGGIVTIAEATPPTRGRGQVDDRSKMRPGAFCP